MSLVETIPNANSSHFNFKNLQKPSQEWSPLEMFFALILGLILLTTVSGNSLILYLFVKSKRTLRSPTHWLIANLAVADLSVGAFVMPILISVSFNDFKWHWGDFLCKSNEYFHFSLCAASLLSMMSIAIERYIGVKYPLRHKRILTKQRIIKIIVLTWILGIGFTASPLTLWPFNGEREPGKCPVNTRSDFVLFMSFSVYLIPVCVICLMYWNTYKQAVKLSLPEGLSAIPHTNMTSFDSSPSYISAHQKSRVGSNPNDKKQPKSDQEKYLERKAKQTYLAKKLSLVVGVMLTLYAPLFIVFLITGFSGNIVSNQTLLAVAWLRYFCSCVNPFLYIFVIPGYKRAFLKMLMNERSSLNNNTNVSSSCPDSRISIKRSKRKAPNKHSDEVDSDSGYPSTSNS